MTLTDETARAEFDECLAKASELVLQMTREEKVMLCSGKDSWSTKAIERLGIPSIWMADGPHGLRKSKGSGVANAWPATCFPTASALAATWDVKLLGEIGRALAGEAQACDVQILLGPGVNMKRSPLCGRNFEYFSEDPVLAGELAAGYILGLQSEGVGACIKHFAANNQEYERMVMSSNVDEATLREIYLAAFEIAIKRAAPWSVMCAYNKLNGTYCSEHPALLHGILKKEWGFRGFVVSDWGAVNDRLAGLSAGLHLEMPSTHGFHDPRVLEGLERGELADARLDEIVTELLSIILHASQKRRAGEQADFDAHHLLARRAAAESIVLLRNDGILPLATSGGQQIAVIGQFARKPRYQGAGSSQVNPTRIAAAYDELTVQLGATNTLSFAPGYLEDGSSNATLFAQASELAAKADVALLFVGLPESYESESFDRTSLDLPAAHNQLVDEVLRVQPNLVVILMNGAAVTMPWATRVKAIVEAWLGGQAGGQAIVDVLTGRVNPSGKLSETFPARLEDTPAFLDFPGQGGEARYGERQFIGYRYYQKRQIRPLFSFGHGLSYTTFAYRDLAFDALDPAKRQLTVSARIRNTGERAGKEVVQLYVGAEHHRLIRPRKELRGFSKIELAPGEEKVVTFELGFRDFAYYDVAVGDWVVDPGSYRIYVGGNSDTPELVASVDLTVKRSAYPKLSKNSTLKDFAEHPNGMRAHDQIVEVMLGVFGGTESTSETDKNEGAQRKAREMALSFLRELPVWKLPAMSEGRLTQLKLEELLLECAT